MDNTNTFIDIISDDFEFTISNSLEILNMVQSKGNNKVVKKKNNNIDFRARNNIAAKKYRNKKKKEFEELEDWKKQSKEEIKSLYKEKYALELQLELLKEENERLKTENISK